MNLKDVLRIATVVVCLFALPRLASAGACVTENVSTLIGTTCTIGDVQFNFTAFVSQGDIAFKTVPGISASSLTFTPGGSFLDPALMLTGSSLSVSAGPLIGFDYQNFALEWTATVISSGLKIASATNTLVGAVVPAQVSSFPPGYFLQEGTVQEGDAIVETFGSNINPASTREDATTINDSLSGTLIALTYSGTATASVTSMDYQYFLTSSATPEPATLVLLGTGLIGLAGLKRLTANGA